MQPVVLSSSGRESVTFKVANRCRIVMKDKEPAKLSDLQGRSKVVVTYLKERRRHDITPATAESKRPTRKTG